MLLRANTIELVKATFPPILREHTAFGQQFYKNLFSNNPEVKHLFNQKNMADGSFPAVITSAVTMYAYFIDNFKEMNNLIKKISHRHVSLVITPKMYPAVTENLLRSLDDILGPSVMTPDTTVAWNDALKFLADTMVESDAKLSDKYAARTGGWRGLRDFTLTDKKEVAEDTVTFTFSPSDGYTGGFVFEPGQYLTIHVPLISPRHYTITSKVGANVLECTTRIVKDGYTCVYMHDKMAIGDKVRLGVPCGLFTLETAEKDVVLVGAGIGITPIWSFLSHLPKEKVKSVYIVEKRPERIPFKDNLDELDLPIDYSFTKTGEAKRPNLDDVAKDLVKRGGEDAVYYLCGPKVFLETLVSSLTTAGGVNVRYEVFGTGGPKKTIWVCEAGRNYELELSHLPIVS